VRREDRARGQELDDEVALGDGVEAVGRDARETQLARDLLGVDRERRAGEGTRAERQDVGASAAVREALAVALELRGTRGGGARRGRAARAAGACSPASRPWRASGRGHERLWKAVISS
jgi:hypothetical protein